MNSSNTLVSIITPMYKGAPFIGATIQSVQKQTYQDWEMLIVDDCSPDGGEGIKVVRQFAENDSRIILIENKTNTGSSGARNTGLEKSSGRYISFLDSDDLWHCDFLKEQLDFLRSNDATLVFSSYNRVDEHTLKPLLKPFIVPLKVNYYSILKTCPIFPSTAIYDTNKYPKQLFDTRLGSMRDDYVYWLKMLKKVDYAYGNKKILVDYRMRKTSVTANKKKVLKPQWNVLRNVEKLSLLRSGYYLSLWAYYSWRKYRK